VPLLQISRPFCLKRFNQVIVLLCMFHCC
jgi:hypothetical protein